MLSLAGTDAVVRAIDAARDVRLSAYTLAPGPVLDALERAAARGAHVAVRYEAAPYKDDGSLAQQDRDAVRRLTAAGAAVSASNDPVRPLHMKAALVDGVVFLDDRNWPAEGPDTILRSDDPADARTVRAALGGDEQDGSGPGGLALEKRRALLAEERTIDGAAGHTIDFQSESFGVSPPWYALRRRALAGDRVRIIVAERDLQGNAREASALRSLAKAGAQIRTAQADEKLAVGDDRAWIGSANGTQGRPATVDWGMPLAQPELVAALRMRFEATWNAPATRRFAV